MRFTGFVRHFPMSRRAADDEDEFARAMDQALQVKRLDADPRGRVHATRPLSTVSVPAPRAAAPKPAPAATPPVSDIDDDPSASYVAPGVDRRELRKIRRGEHVPVQRLDLHGMKSAEGIAKVKRFVDVAQTTCRCVAIVHGRGLGSKDNIAILKPRVRDALRQHTAVLAFADAPPNDGGTGAVYVLLKRK
jgi:DNA-nicking Smr family endonuclease